MRLGDEELLALCQEFFTLGVDGLYYKIWRKGLPKSCIGKRAGNDHHSGYKYVKIKGFLYSEHRLVWLMVYGESPNGEIDHKDLDKSNNNVENMRDSSRSENCSNRNGWSASGYKGVYPNERGKPWFSKIAVDGSNIHLGSFNCPIVAAKAYDKAALKYKGEFAKLNFKQENV